MVAALLHNLSTLLVLGNAGRLLRFEEPLGQPRPAVEGREEEGTP
ncbi:cation-transporting P-type ATPase, partial [Pseudomonas aeruginosa]